MSKRTVTVSKEPKTQVTSNLIDAVSPSLHPIVSLRYVVFDNRPYRKKRIELARIGQLLSELARKEKKARSKSFPNSSLL